MAPQGIAGVVVTAMRIQDTGFDAPSSSEAPLRRVSTVSPPPTERTSGPGPGAPRLVTPPTRAARLPEEDGATAELAGATAALRPPGIQSIERAAAILEIIAQEGGSTRLQTIAAHASLRKSTTHNILATLVRLGYVRRSEVDARYYLGERIMNLARIVGDDARLRASFRPILEMIAARSAESVYLAVPSGDQVFYIDGIDAGDPNRSSNRIGARQSLEGSAIGTVFLAFVPELRERILSVNAALPPSQNAKEIEAARVRGFAVDLECTNAGFNCVAAPVFDRGRLCAAVAVRGPSDRLPRETLTSLAWMMIRQAGEHQPLSRTPVWWPLAEAP